MEYILVSIIFGLLNLYSTVSAELSSVLAVAEYALIYGMLLKGRRFPAYAYFLIFSSVSFEIDAYVYGLDIPFVRYSFYNFPGMTDWMYHITLFAFFVDVIWNTRRDYESKIGTKFFHWNRWLLITGTASILVGMLLNDNGILTSGIYPKMAFSTIMRYFFLIIYFYLGYCYAMQEQTRSAMIELIKIILASVAVVSMIGVLLGFQGHYSDYDYDKIMLAPMIYAYVPCLMLFFNPRKKESYVYLAIALLAIVVSFYHPSAVGSKWYLIIAGCIYYAIYNTMSIKSNWLLVFLLILLFTVTPIVTSMFGTLMDDDDFNSWKFYQAMGVFDIFGYDSLIAWFYSLDDSAQFRIDEIINITMEYIKKPYYALFGKGLAGTTQHYTNFINLDWNADASFSGLQSRFGFFYQMHETSGIIYLRHGVLGLGFIWFILKELFTKMRSNPCAMFGFMWFLFYWGWAMSFRLGAVALILAMTDKEKNQRIVANG